MWFAVRPVTTWQSLFIGLLQGATELFPVSSLGHAVLLPAILHWNFNEKDPQFVPFLTLLHLGTATGLLILFWREWVDIIRGFFASALRGRIEHPNERMAMLLLVGTVPLAILGTFLQTPIEGLFARPVYAAVFLFVNGLILLATEWLRRRRERSHAAADEREAEFKQAGDISFRAAAIIGIAQSLAFLPGISRSGVTISGGLFAGLRHDAAAKFSFLLATPAIAGAGLVEVPKLAGSGAPLGTYVVAAILGGIAAYLSARFLVRYFRSGRLDPYGYYCLAVGAIAFVILR